MCVSPAFKHIFNGLWHLKEDMVKLNQRLHVDHEDITSISMNESECKDESEERICRFTLDYVTVVHFMDELYIHYS